jgi:ABC-2 type transport system permease protein
MIARARFLGTSWLFHFRQMSTLKIYIFDAVILPLILATIAIRMLGTGTDPETTTSVTLGAAVMGMWSTTLSGAGGAISRMRAMGMLEPVVAAPTPLSTALAANSLASSTLGAYAVVAGLIWARYGLGIDLSIASPLLLAAAIAVTMVSTAALGVVLSVSLVMYPRAQSVSNIFEYPIWVLTGAIIPLAIMPTWVSYLSWVVGPAWGMKAIHAAVRGQPVDAVVALAACAAVTAAYWVLGIVLLRHIEKLARERATLPLS